MYKYTLKSVAGFGKNIGGSNRGPHPRCYLHAYQLLFAFDLVDSSHFYLIAIYSASIHFGSLK